MTLFSQIIDKLPLPPHSDQPQPQLCPRSGPLPAHLIISSTRSRWCLQDLDFCTKNTNLEATPGNKTHPGQTQTNLILDPLLYSYPISFSFCFPILSLSFLVVFSPFEGWSQHAVKLGRKLPQPSGLWNLSNLLPSPPWAAKSSQ